MEVGTISEGIQATIDLLESVPVKGRDLETTGLGIMTAIRNLKLINEAVKKAEQAAAEAAGKKQHQVSAEGASELMFMPKDAEPPEGGDEE